MSQSAKKASSTGQVEPPVIKDAEAKIIAGFRERYQGTMGGVLTQWQRFAPHVGKIAGETSLCAYGLCFDTANPSRTFEYMTGVEVADASAVPAEFSVVAIPAQKYAVFSHRGHIAGLRETFDTIWSKALPESGLQVATAVAGAPDFFEFYTQEFDPTTLSGVIEIWIPIQRKASAVS